jgi:hypothetical protein
MVAQAVGNLLTLEFERYTKDKTKAFYIYAKQGEFFEMGIEAEKRYDNEEEDGEVTTEIRTQYMSILLKDEEILELKEFLDFYLEQKKGLR